MDKLCRLQRIILYQHSKTLLHFLFGLIKTLGCKSVSTETPTQVLGIYLDAFYFPLAKNVWMHWNRWRWTHCLWFYCRYEAKGTQETDSQWSSEKFQIYVFFFPLRRQPAAIKRVKFSVLQLFFHLLFQQSRRVESRGRAGAVVSQQKERSAELPSVLFP